MKSYLIVPEVLWSWGLLSLKQKRVTENTGEGKAQRARNADTLIAIGEPRV
jgi:hypothetical protein